ncbi:hypothetical protein SAMN05421679_1105 [Epilithonimonas pallida]|uniref:Uncharacterized protein n=1 Tax=Epilithonimonas pallida TaxID=373671 RepID=A0ABY1R8I0_9FLAO|nr:hypothetical protein SAMN05421679_1105 [Epilithonimonas pallida]
MINNVFVIIYNTFTKIEKLIDTEDIEFVNKY